MNRRDFLLFRRGEGRPVVELAGEQFYMRWMDARVKESTAELFAALERELRGAEELRIRGPAWLRNDELLQRLTPLLVEFRARGGTVRVDDAARS